MIVQLASEAPKVFIIVSLIIQGPMKPRRPISKPDMDDKHYHKVKHAI